jgi:hypothetical protein
MNLATPSSIQKLQKALHEKAKGSPSFRFYALSKTVLGLREGATENAEVVNSLLADLVERGLDFSTPRLYVLDGGKALATAVKRVSSSVAKCTRSAT